MFIIGVILYWAEGTKEKEERPGSGIALSNMDWRIIQIFLRWLEKICKIQKNMITFEIMVHISHNDRVKEIQKFWSKMTGHPLNSFSKVYFKRTKIKKTNRKNTGEKYNGVLKIKVKASSGLVRKIAGWSEGVYEKIK